jgi:peptidoglycan hydrolase CwlO-like protein
MMVRKRLSDMVRHETEKSSMAEVEIVPNESVVVTESTASPTTSGVQSDLEEKIVELKSALETVQNQERSLQEKVLQLQAELDERNQFIARMKTEIQEADLKGKLQKAQDAALQLSEVNSKLIAELKTLKQENESLKTALEPKAQPVPLPPKAIEKPKAHPLARRPYSSTSQPVYGEDFSDSTWLL